MSEHLLCNRHISSKTCFPEVAGLFYSDIKWLIGEEKGVASVNQEMQQQNTEPGNPTIPCPEEYAL